MPIGVAFLQNLPARSEFIKPLTARTFLKSNVTMALPTCSGVRKAKPRILVLL